ncbi:TPA: type 1 fimbrial protein [Enterobacter cloacae]|nr:type 1 fimbrial protein [Enterobacter cloacae]
MLIKKKLFTSLLFVCAACISAGASAAPSAEIILQGIITSTTCDLTVNGGKSTLNVGVYKSGDFTPNTQQGSVPLNVTLRNCAADETGDLIIQGVTSTANNDKNLFVSNDSETVGFMVKDSGGTQLSTSSVTPVSATSGAPVNYTYQVGMGSTTAVPVAGAYSAPVVVAYIVN